MHRFVAVLGAAAVLASGVLLGVGSTTGAAAAPLARATTGASVAQAAPTLVAARASAKGTKARFARETVRPGARDGGPRSIAHVRELQYRLRWAGVFKAGVNGVYGPATKKAVKKFQRKHGLKATGTANKATWKVLIPKTIRGKSAVKKRCSGSGWVACYDRARHQVVLVKNGTVWNSWLVRGGASYAKTRTGSFTVFRRAKSHVSTIYDSAMPYSQFFSGGQAFHGSVMMTDPFSGHSHGCVNMFIEDARQLWSLTSKSRLRVKVYGGWS